MVQGHEHSSSKDEYLSELVPCPMGMQSFLISQWRLVQGSFHRCILCPSTERSTFQPLSDSFSSYCQWFSPRVEWGSSMGPFEERCAWLLGDSDMVLWWGGHIRISFLERGEEDRVAVEKLFSEAAMHVFSFQIHTSSLDVFLKLKIPVNFWIAPWSAAWEPQTQHVQSWIHQLSFVPPSKTLSEWSHQHSHLNLKYGVLLGSPSFLIFHIRDQLCWV